MLPSADCVHPIFDFPCFAQSLAVAPKNNICKLQIEVFLGFRSAISRFSYSCYFDFRGHVQMTSANFSGILTPSSPCRNSKEIRQPPALFCLWATSTFRMWCPSGDTNALKCYQHGFLLPIDFVVINIMSSDVPMSWLTFFLFPSHK